MQLSEKREVTGKHEGEEFMYNNGKLTMFNISWSKNKIKKLIEVANLLEVEGFKLADVLPKQKPASSIFDLWKDSNNLYGYNSSEGEDNDD